MNVDNRTLFIADNLDIMPGINTDSIDLIYLDPPFNSKKEYKAPIGSPAEGASFKDIWTDEEVRDGWYSKIAEDYPHIHQIILAAEHTSDHSMMIYLMAMGMRLIEMKRILKPAGSIYLHCDPTASHYLKLVMDSIFGKKNFQSEVIWGYRTQGVSMSNWPKKHDTLLHYCGGMKPTFHPQMQRVYYQKAFRHTKIDDEGRHYADVYVRDVWDDDPETKALISQAKERTGWPTQKPLALLHRIINASSNEGDIVLDPFCGCATACVAAEQLNRQWIGIDIAPSAETITKYRLLEEVQPLQPELWHDVDANVIVTSQVPIRSDIHQYREELKQSKLPNYRVHKNVLYGKQEGYCKGCERHLEIRNLTVDHKHPQSKGGTDHPDNLQLLCQACNSAKGAGTQEELISRLKEQGVLR